MAGVTFEHVSKRFEDTTAVDDLTMVIPDREFLVLVGPSGCGKSTVLRMLAGLETITGGEVKIGDRVVNHVPAKDRDIAMVFQSYALYPHMSVYDNMAFSLTLKKMPKAEIKRKVHEAAELLGIEALLGRKPRQLSGGQRQRVALGRAIVRDPAVFLFDEPLSNLDAKLRVQTRAEITKLHQRLGTTFIYVTHDQVEAMTMATRIAVLSAGRLQQLGTPQEVYAEPTNVFVAGFIGSPATNFFRGVVRDEGEGMSIDTGDFKLRVNPGRQAPLKDYIGREVIAGVRPEHIHDAAYQPADTETDELDVQVDVTEMMGNESLLHLVAGQSKLLARVDPRTKARPGEPLRIAIDTTELMAFDPETELALR
ncbi:MAG: sn-glycerol-3-phosphate ABC transporter ATP-binding protein UgpC [Dehalococcoidia bacterium]|nr:sn-glycerol-3-phosphate ABC transporter ATP-binding protein UgpC [Dehalococcoidia bacterium]